MTGSTLSHYRIVSEVGRGGMGIVYLGEDTKLGRKVAIKVLPSSALASEDDRARFYREAKAAAALNHPNIAQIYQIDEAVPSDAPHGTQPSPFIAMEYIDGEPLEARIKRGPLKLPEAIRITTQIAGALGEAHEKGIVHRDVKASNVMLTSKGDAKVLDFGLALTAASTKLTRMGSTLGTVAYMSPEQARGEEVDRRTDLWALGVVLYEMVAGRNPFGGDYEQAVVYSILNTEPEPLTAVRTGVPMEFERIVSKALAKAPDLRYQTASGLIADLAALDIADNGMSRRNQPDFSAVSSVRVRQPVWIFGAIGMVFLALGAAFGVILTRDTQPNGHEMASLQAELIVADARFHRYPSLSEDGQFLAFAGSMAPGGHGLILTDLVSGVVRHFPSDASGAGYSAISPDGRWVVWNAGAELRKAPTSGGPAVTIGPRCFHPVFLDNERFMCDGPEGAGGGSRLVIADLNGTFSEPVVTRNTAAGVRRVYATDFIPGKRLAVGMTTGDDVTSQLSLFDLKDGTIEKLNQDGSFPRYVDSGHLVFLGGLGTSGLLMARPFDAEARRFTGPAAPIMNQLHSRQSYDVTASGLMVTTSGATDYSRWEFVWWDTSGSRLEAMPIEPGGYLRPVISPDGSRIAVEIESAGTTDVWIIDSETGAISRFEEGRHPAWSADGTHLFMSGTFEGVDDALLVKPADNSGVVAVAFDASTSGGRPNISRDGNTIVYQLVDEDGIQVRSLTYPDSSRTIGQYDGQWDPDLSTDGEYVAYISSSGGSWDIVVQQAWGDAVWTVSSPEHAFAFDPKWSPDGQWLYYLANSQLWRSRIQFEPVFRSERPELVLGLPGVEFDYDLHPDGERILISSPPENQTESVPHLMLRVNTGRLLSDIAPRSQ